MFQTTNQQHIVCMNNEEPVGATLYRVSQPSMSWGTESHYLVVENTPLKNMFVQSSEWKSHPHVPNHQSSSCILFIKPGIINMKNGIMNHYETSG